MANMPHRFKDRDVRRLIKAAQAAGLHPIAVEVDLARQRITVTGGKSEALAEGEPRSSGIPHDSGRSGGDKAVP
jgi:hypothetical protein